jgi:hypothetical protein
MITDFAHPVGGQDPASRYTIEPTYRHIADE